MDHPYHRSVFRQLLSKYRKLLPLTGLMVIFFSVAMVLKTNENKKEVFSLSSDKFTSGSLESDKDNSANFKPSTGADTYTTSKQIEIKLKDSIKNTETNTITSFFHRLYRPIYETNEEEGGKDEFKGKDKDKKEKEKEKEEEAHKKSVNETKQKNVQAILPNNEKEQFVAKENIGESDKYSDLKEMDHNQDHFLSNVSPLKDETEENMQVDMSLNIASSSSSSSSLSLPKTMPSKGTSLRKDNIENSMSTSEKSKTKPHLIYILIDDQGMNDVGYLGGDAYTPNQDKLAADGIILENFYSMHLCTPARGVLLTGKFAHNIGLQHEVIQPASPWGLPLKFQILPEFLNTIGNYTSHIVGKWHLGHYKKEYLPTNRGFSTFFGYFIDQIDYFTRQYPYKEKGETVYNWVYSDQKDLILLDKETTNIDAPDYLTTNDYSSRVKKILQDHKKDESPLFLYLPLQNDHSPLPNITNEYFNTEELQELGKRNNLDDITSERLKFLKLNLFADKFIGKLVDNLKEYGYYDNSIIFVSSDNGACFQAGGSNFPLRGTKHYLYEGGVKVPGFVHSPLIPEAARGTTFSDYIHMSDIFPTFARLAGATGEMLENLDLELDGSDMWSSIIGEEEGANKRDDIIVSYDPYTTEYSNDDDGPTEYLAIDEDFIGALIQGPYKYIHNEYNVSWYTTSTTVSDDSHPECAYLYESYSQTSSLFNIATDPHETENLLSSKPSVIAENGLTHHEIANNMSGKLSSLINTQFASAFVGQDTTNSIELWSAYNYNICPWGDTDQNYIKLQSSLLDHFDISDILGKRYERYRLDDNGVESSYIIQRQAFLDNVKESPLYAQAAAWWQKI